MLDIETLSSRRGAVVTAIGVAYFNETAVTGSCVWYLDYTADSGHIDPRTVRWWLEQDEAIRTTNLRGAAPSGDQVAFVTTALKGRQVWGNGPQFDCGIMRDWFGRHGADCPWHWRDERDCRTMFEIGRKLEVAPPVKTNSHDARADAVWQAEYVLAIERAVYGRCNTD